MIGPVLLFTAVSLAVTAHDAPALPAGAGDPTVRDAISRAWREHIQAAIRKDLDGVVDIYADDIVYVVADSPEVRGIRSTRTGIY
jgi:hypothetical protein